MSTTVASRWLRRLFATSLVATLAALGSVSPTLAGSSTLWVDLDGLAGTTGCDSTDAAYTTVQSAIDASASGDTILVCPGTYPEELLIDGSHDGLTIRSAQPIRALILTPPIMATGALITIHGVNGVSLEQLDLQTLAEPPCPSVSAMVAVRGGAQDIALRHLSIAPGGTGTMGPCSFYRGIKALRHVSIEVTDSTIRDFVRSGITLKGVDTNGRVLRNTVLFLHATVAYNDGLNDGGQGIAAERGAHAVIRENRVDAGPEAGPGGTPDLNMGISMFGKDVVATHNRLRHVFQPIYVWSDNARVAHNDLRDGIYGIFLNGVNGAVIVANTVRAFDYGTGVAFSEGNVLRRNMYRNNRLLDCYDQTTGAGTAGTANTWIDNIGVSSDPAGICSPPA